MNNSLRMIRGPDPICKADIDTRSVPETETPHTSISTSVSSRNVHRNGRHSPPCHTILPSET